MRPLLKALLVVSAFAPVANAEVLTREQAIERAIAADPRIEERAQWVEYARAQLSEARGNAGFMVDFNAFVGLSSSVEGGFFEENSCTTNPDGCQVRSDRYDLGGWPSLWNYVELQLIKPLYTFGKIENYAKAAQANIEVKQSDVRLQRGQTIVDVNRAWFGYLAARDTYLFLEDIQRRVEGAVELVEGWLEEGEGNVSQGDLYALKAGRALVARNVAQARGLQQVALAGLKMLTEVEEVEVADRGLQPLPLPEQDLIALQETAMERRPEVHQLERGLEARRALVAANKAMAKPNLYTGISGIISYSPGRDRLDNPHIYDPFNDWGATPMLGLKWDWQPAVNEAKTAQAREELDALVATAAFARKGIPFQVAEQYYQVQAGRQGVDQMAEGSRDARRWMISTYTDFEAGLEQADALVTAFQGYVLAHTDYLRAVFDYNMGVVQLEYTIGAYE